MVIRSRSSGYSTAGRGADEHDEPARTFREILPAEAAGHRDRLLQVEAWIRRRGGDGDLDALDRSGRVVLEDDAVVADLDEIAVLEICVCATRRPLTKRPL